MTESVARLIVTESRLLIRSCEALLGIAAGLIADGELNDREIGFLSAWLSEHPELAATWPGEVVYRRVRTVLADGVITNEERLHLEQTLVDLVGGNFSKDGALAAGSTVLPVDENANVDIDNRSFCFTGQFLYGTRARCERAVIENSGRVAKLNQALDFLVIGELTSRDWKYSSHGTKIENAINLRLEGSSIKIVSEAHWIRALPKLS